MHHALFLRRCSRLLTPALCGLATLFSHAQALLKETSFGGTGGDTIFATVSDGTVVYVAGITTSADFPVTDGSTYQGDAAGVGDIFLAKLDLEGNLLAATLLGGSGSDFANGLVLSDGIAVPDGQGGETIPKVLTLSGWTSSTDFKTLNPLQAANAGKTDAVIAQFDTSLNLLFSTYLGGAEDDQFSGVAGRDFGDFFVFYGFTASTDFPFPTPNGNFAQTTKGRTDNADGLLVTLARNRAYRMGTLFRRLASGTQSEVILGGAFGPGSSRIFVTGWTDDASFFRHASDPVGTGRRIFMSEFDYLTAGRQYSRVIGGSGDDIGHAIATTSEGIVVLGQTSSTDFPGTTPTFQTGYGGGASDAVLVAWDYAPANSFVTVRPASTAYLGGSGDDIGRAIQKSDDRFGQTTGLQFAGVTGSANFPLLATPQNAPAQATYGGGPADGFFGRMQVNRNTGGPAITMTPRDLTFHGGAGEEGFTSLAVLRESGGEFETVVGGAANPDSAGLAASLHGAGAPGGAKDGLTGLYTHQPQSGPDLIVTIEPRAPLVEGAEEVVFIVISNKSSATLTAREIEMELETDSLLSGQLTGEILRVALGEVVLTKIPGNPDYYELPGSLAPGQSVRLAVTLRSLPGALLGTPPGVGLRAFVDSDDPDLFLPDNSTNALLPLPLLPLTDVGLVITAPTARALATSRLEFSLQVENFSSTTKDVLLNLTLENLDQLALLTGDTIVNLVPPAVPGGPFQAALVALRPGEVRQLRLLATARPGLARLTGEVLAEGDSNPENNTATVEVRVIPWDYAVEILSQVPGFTSDLNALAAFLGLTTRATITVTLPFTISPNEAPPVVLTLRHAGPNVRFVTDPPSVSIQCEAVDATTTRCVIPVSSIVTAAVPNTASSGTLNITVVDSLNPADVPIAPRVSFSVEGDGENPNQPNNFAERSTDMTQVGSVSLTPVSQQARTVVIEGAVRVVMLTRIRVRNDGPGTVRDLALLLDSRIGARGGGVFEPAKVVAGVAAGVRIITRNDEEEVTIEQLAAGAETILELADFGFVFPDGSVQGAGGQGRLTAPPGVDLTPGDNRIVVLTPTPPSDNRPDLSVTVRSQRVAIEIIGGVRTPFLITELEVANLGTAPVVNAELALSRLGVTPVSIVKSPEPETVVSVFPNAPTLNPQVLRLGDFAVGTTLTLTVRDEILSPGTDQLIGLTGLATHDSFDSNVANNRVVTSREYLGRQATLDYAIFIRSQTLETRVRDGQSVNVLRTHLEIVISGDAGAVDLPLVFLQVAHAGISSVIEPVAKDGSTTPASGISCVDLPVFETECRIPVGVARSHFFDVIDDVVLGAQAKTLTVTGSVTGDGETPAAGNNNRARSSLDYTPDPAEPVPDISVTLLKPGTEIERLRYKETVTDRYLIRNKSTTVTARAVQLTLTEAYLPPLPADAPALLRIVAVTGDLPDETRQCLVTPDQAACLLGDLEPGGLREVAVTVRFGTLPATEEGYPDQIIVGLQASRGTRPIWRTMPPATRTRRTFPSWKSPRSKSRRASSASKCVSSSGRRRTG